MSKFVLINYIVLASMEVMLGVRWPLALPVVFLFAIVVIPYALTLILCLIVLIVGNLFEHLSVGSKRRLRLVLWLCFPKILVDIGGISVVRLLGGVPTRVSFGVLKVFRDLEGWSCFELVKEVVLREGFWGLQRGLRNASSLDD